MSSSDQNDILQWNEAQRSLIMDFALENAEDYFNDDSICSYARFDHEFFWPLVAEFNGKFGTQATSRMGIFTTMRSLLSSPGWVGSILRRQWQW
jgi:hypothetical protein